MPNWRGTGKLLALPCVRSPVGMAICALGWLVALELIPLLGPASIFGVAAVNWGGGMLLGLTLRSLMRSETLMLPYVRQHLAAAAGVYLFALVVLPAGVALVSHGSVHLVVLAVALLVLALAVGVASGTGSQVTMVLALAFIVPSMLPHPARAVLTEVVTTSWLVPLLACLLAILLLELSLRPLLEIRDRNDDESPMQAVADGRKPTNTSASGTPRRRGAIGKKLASILDATARSHLLRALRRYTRKPSASARMHLIRAVLLPHDNLAGIAVNALVIAAVVVFYILLFDRSGAHAIGFVAGYAIVIGLSRFAAVGHGMLKMRPNLADLYLTLGPATQREFQATLADALLWPVVVVTFNIVVYTALIVLVLHASAPAALLLTSLIVGIGSAFGALALHLVGPESNGGRIVTQLVLMVAAMAIYALIFWLMQRFGMLVGGVLGSAICLPFGLGAWQAARREYLSRRPCFDAPLE